MKKSIKDMSIDQIIKLTTQKAIDYNRIVCRENLKKTKGKEFI